MIKGGEREKAMKCLLKSGDTKAICYYATVSRNRNIYILAANYLQALDWQNDAETMKNIVLFYTKAKAFEQLSSFFDAYAQMEIDEYRDYEKALSGKDVLYMYVCMCVFHYVDWFLFIYFF
jgi:intraflagellar transport protein 140